MSGSRHAIWHWKNPIIVKDVRTRMRGHRTFILLTAHLVILLLAVGSAYLIFQSALTNTGNLEERRFFGKAVFGLLAWIELVMISFVAPALTSGAIAAERERQTYDLLRVTLLSAPQLVLGKFLPGLLFVLLLLFTSVPLQGPSYMIGGVQWQEIALATLLLTATATAFCALGMLLSSLIRRTLIATAISYAITIFLVFGIPIVALIFLALFSSAFSLGINEISPGSERLLLFLGWVLVSITPLGAAIGTEVILLDQQSLFLARIPLSNDQIVLLPAPWMPYIFFYLLFSVVAIWLSIQLVKQVDS
jgi:ABC-type transport system involved in multi-copper enzyme maturation permease subunit